MSFPDSIMLSREEIMRSGTTQVCPLGTRGTLRDGRVFRYCKAAAALAPGKMVQQALMNVILSVPQTSNFYPATDFGTTYGTTWSEVAFRMTRYLDATALAADEYKEGFVYVGGTGHPAGVGQMWKIKTHTGVTASSTGYVKFTFDDGGKVETAFNTDVTFGVCKNAYDDVIQVVTGAEPTAPVIGVSVCVVASGDYCWIQTWGKCVAYIAAATSARAALTAATDAAMTGFAVLDSGDAITLNDIYAVSPNVIVAGAYAPIDLKISP